MVVPEAVMMDALHGRVNEVRAWLDNSPPNAVNDVDENGHTLLYYCCFTCGIYRWAEQKQVFTDEHYQLAQYLLSRGADVSRGIPAHNVTPLHAVASRGAQNSSPMASLLISAKAELNAVESHGETPLAKAIVSLEYEGRVGSCWLRRGNNNEGPLDVIVCLLRGGVSLDSVCPSGASRDSARIAVESLMQSKEVYGPYRNSLRRDRHWIACKEMVAGVRKYGSWKAYRRAPHKSILRLRSLFVRGRAKTADRRLARIANLPNGPCWRVLAFWRAAD